VDNLNKDSERIVFSPSTYKAARTVAVTVADHFAYHHTSARTLDKTGDFAPKPDAEVIESIIDRTFWASLRREEGRSPTISVAYLPPEKSVHPLIFEKPLDFTPHVLTKLAPAVERSGIHLGVWLDGDQLYIWGTTRFIPPLCFVLEVVEPGMLVIKHRRADGFGKFVNVAVLKGDQVKVIDEESARLPDCPNIVNSLLGLRSSSLWNEATNGLVQLAVSMRAHGRGGALLVVPSGNERWRETIVHPISYAVAPNFSELASLYHSNENGSSIEADQGKMTQAIERLAGLTAVDGATIINDRYELLAFGAKIARAPGRESVERILATEPIVGNKGRIIHPAQNGGTRHLSAAQFVSDQHGALALVASQDGRFTIFSWSQCEQIVQAHRVDVLLL
jgi:DNA integrity scanning protein DisA with diadenylate cyclase activity